MSVPGQYNRLLNDVLIALNRSLLQYVGDAWPWTETSAEAARFKLAALVARQRTQSERLTELLIDRRWSIDFGTYPTEYTDLHYVALDYLFALLVDNERGLINDIERARAECAGDREAVRILDGGSPSSARSSRNSPISQSRGRRPAQPDIPQRQFLRRDGTLRHACASR